MATNGTKPPDSADKGLGEIVTEVTSKAQLLVKEEIELAKAEVTAKVSKLAKGAGFFAGAAILGVFGLIWFFHFLAIGIADWTGLKVWVGYLIVTVLLFIVVGILAMLGLRSVKKGSPPTPELAIEEAKKTRAVLEEARN
jgi:Putative Actinobacterial Holin-X, holin superfamily III